MKLLKAYEYLEPASCSLAGTPRRLANDNLSNIYLAGSFISSSVFFLLVYSNGKADSTFYVHYLDLEAFIYLARLGF